MPRRLLMTVALSACATRVIGVPPSSLAERDLRDASISLAFDYAPYRVRGTSEDAIRRSLDRRSTYQDGQGQTWDGGTTWQFRWSWDTELVDGCRITRPQLSGSVTVTVPALIVPRRADGAAVDRFTGYLDALWQHELGHVERAERGARTLIDTLASLPPQPTCAQAHAAAKAAGAAAMKALDVEQRIYDRDTQHGATQGASFP
jgi:predicted secreted Zn-dependent protease